MTETTSSSPAQEPAAPRPVANPRRTAALLTVAGAMVLLSIAVFHATGTPLVSRALTRANVTPFVRDAMPKLWLFFSWHLIALALAALGSTRTPPATTRLILTGAALVAIVDVGWVVSVAGIFAGSVLLLLGAILLFAAARFTPQN